MPRWCVALNSKCNHHEQPIAPPVSAFVWGNCYWVYGRCWADSANDYGRQRAAIGDCIDCPSRPFDWRQANLALEQARQIQRWATRQHQEQQAPALARRSELSAATPAVGGDVVAGSVPNNRSLGQLRRWSRQRASRHSAVPLPHSGPAPFPMAADLLPPPAVAQRRAITPDGAHIAQGALQPLAAPIPVPTAGALRGAAGELMEDGEGEGEEDNVPPQQIRRISRLRRRQLYLAARRPYQEPVTRHDLGRMDVECIHCRALHWMAEKVSGSTANTALFGMCCLHGKVKIDPIPDPPDIIRTLLTSMEPTHVQFRENIWRYNRSFAFTSLGVQEDWSVNGRGRGPPVFRISGELTHLSGALVAEDGEAPRYSQLYVIEPQAALDSRQAQNATLNPGIMALLQNALNQHHQYVPVYQHAYEVLRNYDTQNDVDVRLRLHPGLDKRRYNLPTVDEVAVLLPGTVSTRGRDIVLRLRQNNNYLDRISELHPAYTPLQYPLLFPFGTNGWHQFMTLDAGGGPMDDEPDTFTTYRDRGGWLRHLLP